MVSDCCAAALKTERQVERYHGSDDNYELVIPFQICSKCGKIQLKAVENDFNKKFVPIEGVK
jgi:hypothetical protein